MDSLTENEQTPRVATGWQPSWALGRWVYALGVTLLGVLMLAWGDFLPIEPAPKTLPARLALAYAAGAFQVLGGLAVGWRRTAALGGAALAAYFIFVVTILMNGPLVIKHYQVYGSYFGFIEPLTIATGGLVVFAGGRRLGASPAARLTLAARIMFGICVLYFGGAHFIYMNLTAPLVPTWLPPNQTFWGYATGVCFLAAGAALLSGVQARLAAFLLTAMLGLFLVLVHAPMVAASPLDRGNWSEAVACLAILGVAWVMADALPPLSRLERSGA